MRNLLKEKPVSPLARRIERKFLSILKLLSIMLIAGGACAGVINSYLNEGHAATLGNLEQKVADAEAARDAYYMKVREELSLIADTKKMELQIKVIDTYFDRKNAGVLKWKGDAFVAVSRLYWLDPYRMVSIAMWESKGTSYAARVQNNICGMNWPNEELSLLRDKGYNPDIYNVKVYGSVAECIMAQGFKLKTLYKDYWGLEQLSEIQPRWAPDNDKREGLSGMYNSKWAAGTIKIYRELEALEKELRGVSDE